MRKKVCLKFNGVIVGVTGGFRGRDVLGKSSGKNTAVVRHKFHYTNFPENSPTQKLATSL